MGITGTTAKISIHALRKESDLSRQIIDHQQLISIHALRKESDRSRRAYPRPCQYFNPRSP